MAKEGKKKKSCSGNRKLMFFYGFTQLGARVFSAVALVAIAISLCAVKKESSLFINCVEELAAQGRTTSEAVRACKGGS